MPAQGPGLLFFRQCEPATSAFLKRLDIEIIAITWKYDKFSSLTLVYAFFERSIARPEVV